MCDFYYTEQNWDDLFHAAPHCGAMSAKGPMVELLVFTHSFHEDMVYSSNSSLYDNATTLAISGDQVRMEVAGANETYFNVANHLGSHDIYSTPAFLVTYSNRVKLGSGAADLIRYQVNLATG